MFFSLEIFHNFTFLSRLPQIFLDVIEYGRIPGHSPENLDEDIRLCGIIMLDNFVEVNHGSN